MKTALLSSNDQDKITKTAYTPDQLKSLDKARIPYHVAMIPDGNRRWAKKHFIQTIMGHRKGLEAFTDAVKASKELGIKVFTLYSFSTENWSRSRSEVESLMNLINDYLSDQREQMIEDGIRLQTIGDISRLPNFLLENIIKTKSCTAHCHNMELVLALNYGGRDEIKRAIQAIVEDFSQDLLKKENIDEKTISRYLDTRAWPDPDLLLRTSGEMRISNFMLWQTSYTEIYFSPVLWPDFTPRHLLEAVLHYQQREKRLGGA